MIRPLKYSICLVLLLCAVSVEMLGQANCSELGRKNRETLAREVISELGPHSILAIRLQGYQRQIVELNKLIDATTPNSKAQKRLKKRRSEYLESPSRWLNHLENAFATHYDISQVVFYFDHDQSFVKDEEAKIWLTDKGKAEKLEKYSPPKLYLVQGTTSERGLEAFKLKDESFHKMCPPFPAYFKMNSLSTFFLAGEKEERKKAENLAKSVQATISELRKLL